MARGVPAGHGCTGKSVGAAEPFPWDSWWRFAIVEAGLTEDRFWSSTVAQLAALLPPTPETAKPQRGTGDDLVALASMAQ